MDPNEADRYFNELNSTIKRVDSNIRSILPLIANRLQLSGAGKTWNESEALIALKKELRKFNIAKRQWLC